MRDQPPGLHPLTAEALEGGARARAARRSCCSTVAAGRTSSPVVRADASGAAPSATWRSCCTARAAIVACHHCGHHEPAPAALHVRLDVGRPPRRRHRAPPARARRDARRRRLSRLPPGCGHGRSVRAQRLPARRVVWAQALPSGRVGDLLSRFEAAPAGVLIGTQMVAKGHDFADVTLGVVLDADATLRFPDFRAEERTFALVTQLAGRVGRGNDGHVLVQSIAPEARSIVHAAAHDSDGFLAGELERRRALEYPPFSSLIRVVCSAEHSARAHAAASGPARAAGRLRRQCPRSRGAVSPARPRASGAGRQGAARAALAGDRPRSVPRFGRRPTRALTAASISASTWIPSSRLRAPAQLAFEVPPDTRLGDDERRRGDGLRGRARGGCLDGSRARPGDQGAPRRGPAPCAQVRRPGAARHGAAGRSLRRVAGEARSSTWAS